MRIHISVFIYLMALAMFAFGYFYEFACYLTAIVLHEMAHAEAAKRLGYRLNEFKLMPYGAALVGEFEGASWGDEIKIASAGPIMNAFLAIVSAAVWWLVPETYVFTYDFAVYNMCLIIFNVLPVFPLDGGRIFLALLSYKMPRQTAYKRTRIFGYILSAVFFVLFCLSFFYNFNLSFATVAIFILLSTVIPDRHSMYQRLYNIAYRNQKLKRGIGVREIAVSLKTETDILYKKLNGGYITRFTVFDNENKVCAQIYEDALERLPSTERNKPLKEVLNILKK